MVMNNTDNTQQLTDDVLNNISGGRATYSTPEFKKAGVSVTYSNGIPSYTTTLSNGSILSISESVANSMVDCFKLSGDRLTDQELDDLIRQS